MENQGFFKKAFRVLTKPSLFFKEIKEERDLTGALLFILPFFVIIYSLLAIIVFITQSSIKDTIVVLVLALLGFIVIIGVSLGIFHTLIALFGGKESFQRTFQIFVYALTPNLLFFWIPIINLLASLYSAFLEVVGLRELQKLSLKKSVLVVIIANLIIGLLVFGFSGGIKMPADTKIVKIWPEPEGDIFSFANDYLDDYPSMIEDTMYQNQYKTYSLNGVDYEVGVTSLNVEESTVSFEVNGQGLGDMKRGDTKILADGQIFGANSIIINKDETLVSFFMGSK